MILKKRIIVQSKDIKEKKMHINLIKLNLTKSVHLRGIVTRVAFLRFMYVVVCSIVNIMIEDIKIKAMFNNEIKINYTFK